MLNGRKSGIFANKWRKSASATKVGLADFEKHAQDSEKPAAARGKQMAVVFGVLADLRKQLPAALAGVVDFARRAPVFRETGRMSEKWLEDFGKVRPARIVVR